jgi:predicted Zn-dependent protease
MLNATARKWLPTAGIAFAIAAFTPQAISAPDNPFEKQDAAKERPKRPKEKSQSKEKSKSKEKSESKQKDSALDQDQVYSLGYWQAKNGRYEAALATLRSARDQDDPRIQTMVGFTLRKVGRVDEALSYYFKALATRPDATTTRQYLGEAYLQIGDTARAREQLAEINRRCGTTCEDYTALAEEIAKYEHRQGG